MYNRYIPQADGTFRRNRITEPENQKSVTPTDSPLPKDAPNETLPPNPPKKANYPHPSSSTQHRAVPQPTHDAGSVSSFLRGLLPQNFDTEDLIVVLLLLLMSGNSSGDQNAALLTLGIYLFL